MTEQRFFGRGVEVACERDAAGFLLPTRFVLGKETIQVAGVVAQWHDHGFHATVRSRTWLERRHRTFYRVRAEDGRLFELYLDRTGSRRVWFVTREWAPGDPADPPPSEPAHR